MFTILKNLLFKGLRWRLIACCTAAIATTTIAQTGQVTPPSDSFACGSSLETTVWNQWDGKWKQYLQDHLLGSMLTKQGDTYALYNTEIFYHNLLAMAQRCQRYDRQREISGIVQAFYAELSAAPSGQPGKAWVCRGGPTCNEKNKLLNTEVQLNSAQFLAFGTNLARNLAHGAESVKTAGFIAEAAAAAADHLNRWNTPQSRQTLQGQIAARPTDVKNGSSALGLTDRVLWQISAYADLAGIIAKRPDLVTKLGLDAPRLDSMRSHLSLLLRLVEVRTSRHPAPGSAGQAQNLADLDRGFWRLYGDNRYAGYTGKDKPVVCGKDADKGGKLAIQTKIDAKTLPVDESIGWDISHARRLVHFFDAIQRNREALAAVYGVADKELPAKNVVSAFARQLFVNVWNQDQDWPLFANYFSGANGWYRVAYDNGTGRCLEGFPPSGLSDAFPTGGFATWSVLEPQLRPLGQRIYELSQSDEDSDQAFVESYYKNLGKKRPLTRRASLN